MQDPEPDSLVNFLPFQDEVFHQNMRILFLLWRRQAGKSYLFACKALDRMMAIAGHSVFVVSASLKMGKENVRKEVEVWRSVLTKARAMAAQAGLKLTTSGDDDKGELLDIDALEDLFSSSQLEARIWHSNTIYSRTLVLAPNPDTARGFSGDVFGDEIGFWPDFQGVFDAVEPIISRNPTWLLWLATTPPKDDTHPTFELLAPKNDSFPVNPRGNWFELDNGFPCHRCDAYDAQAAGLPMYDLKSGGPIGIEEARRRSLNRQSFDRNYLLKFLNGGAAALTKAYILNAQAKGREFCTAVDIQ